MTYGDDMRRLFIFRKDILKDEPGKAMAMVAHCAEAYWTNSIRANSIPYLKTYDKSLKEESSEDKNEIIGYELSYVISKDIFEQYINNSFVKTICEARNLNHLKKAAVIAEELNLVENEDYGFINDNCKTVFSPENEDGTTTVGILFKPLPDDVSHKISKKYQLYR